MISRDNLWSKFFDKDNAIDYAGRKINRTATENSKEYFNIDHVVPNNNNKLYNLMPVSKETNKIKGNKTKWIDNDINYEILSFKTLRKVYGKSEYSGKGYVVVSVNEDGSKTILQRTISE